MNKFKKGDKFIPRKPINIDNLSGWVSGMDKYQGKTLTVKCLLDEEGDVEAEETDYCFSSDWCEKVDDNSKISNESGLEFKDISTEKYRTYEWGDGFKLTIIEPTHLNVSKSGEHRILDKSGKSHYIPNGWRHLYWEVFDGQPNFVK